MNMLPNYSINPGQLCIQYIRLLLNRVFLWTSLWAKLSLSTKSSNLMMNVNYHIATLKQLFLERRDLSPYGVYVVFITYLLGVVESLVAAIQQVNFGEVQYRVVLLVKPAVWTSQETVPVMLIKNINSNSYRSQLNKCNIQQVFLLIQSSKLFCFIINVCELYSPRLRSESYVYFHMWNICFFASDCESRLSILC